MENGSTCLLTSAFLTLRCVLPPQGYQVSRRPSTGLVLGSAGMLWDQLQGPAVKWGGSTLAQLSLEMLCCRTHPSHYDSHILAPARGGTQPLMQGRESTQLPTQPRRSCRKPPHLALL